MDVQVREFSLDDYGAAVPLWDAADGMATPTQEEVARKLERDPQLFLIAERSRELVGVVMGAYDGRRGWIFRLAVDPAERGTGVGRLLVDELERRFRDMGVSGVRLLVWNGNHGGLAFWERLGYALDRDVVLASKELGDGAGTHC